MDKKNTKTKSSPGGMSALIHEAQREMLEKHGSARATFIDKGQSYKQLSEANTTSVAKTSLSDFSKLSDEQAKTILSNCNSTIMMSIKD